MLFGRKHFIARAISAMLQPTAVPDQKADSEEGINVFRCITEEFYATVVDAAPNWTSGGGLRNICL